MGSLKYTKDFLGKYLKNQQKATIPLIYRRKIFLEKWKTANIENYKQQIEVLEQLSSTNEKEKCRTSNLSFNGFYKNYIFSYTHKNG